MSLLFQLLAASRRGATQSAYVQAVLADSPYAFFRLNEAPGATTINDSSGNGRHVSGLPAGVTLGHRPLVADVSGGSASFDGTAGISLGSAFAAAILANPTWSVELTLFPAPDASTGNAGFPISGAASGTQRFAVQHFGTTLYTQSTVGGIKSTPAGKVNSQVHHLVVCSDGTAYWNGIAISGTTGPSLNNTVGFWLGCLNSGTTGFFLGRISDVSLYQSVLSPARAQAHYQASRTWSLPAGRTFRWSMESPFPETVPVGSDDRAQFDQSSVLSSAQAFAGAQSLAVSTAWAAATFDNTHNFPAWMPMSQGAFRFKFRYTGAIGGTAMLFQLTGKDRTSQNDTNDGVSCTINPTGGITFQSVNIPIANAPADQWHDLILRWRTTGSPHFVATINGTSFTSTTPPAAATALAWHHLLIGNDRNMNTAGLWIDEFEAHASFNSPDLPAYP